MTESIFSSPARSLGERSLGDPNSLTDSDMTETDLDVFDIGIDLPNSDQVVVDGWLKFRDNKKWKQRWGVVTKLSPAADCLHLQLYRDSRDRYKQGQTKASLSLQHFLGVETGFTLDKESNTIAIICQDVTVVLAFDTRERLIQWQVKISCNLGEDQQFLVLVSQAPSKAKISTGPARLHVQEMKFCMTSGIPPRLIGFWEIGHLRRYGVIEGRFCFEGGSRCGKGEGLYVLVTDQSGEITRTLQMAAQGKLTSRRPLVSRKSSVVSSPKKLMHPRQEIRNPDIFSESSREYLERNVDSHNEHPVGSPYWSIESRPTDLDSNYGCGDTSSVHMHGDVIWPNSDGRTVASSLERCVSCISKLGAPTMSRSSTANTSTLFNPAWTMEPVPVCTHQNTHWGSGSDRTSVSSHGTGSSDNSEYFISKHYCQENRLVQSNPPLPPKNYKPDGGPQIVTCHCQPPDRPPKPVKETSPTRKPIKKPPMPLPTEVENDERRTPEPDQQRLLDNYDVPKSLLKEVCAKQPSLEPNQRPSLSPIPFDYYDTPKNVKENLCCTGANNYGNYDTLPPAKTLRKPCGCVVTFARQAANTDSRPECPCQKVMCWAENWMMLPYCRRGQGIENTSIPIQKVKLSGEGKMPVVNASGEVAIYATVDKSKKNGKTLGNNDSDRINYENINLGEKENDDNAKINEKGTNYENIKFAKSLEYYENSKDILQKAEITQEEMVRLMQSVNDKVQISFSLNNGVKVCNKCGHARESNENVEEQPSTEKTCTNLSEGEDYLMMKPSKEKNLNRREQDQAQNFPGYLPMYPGNKAEDTKKEGESKQVEKSASVSSLPGTCANGVKKRNSDARISASAMMFMPSTANPYIRRLLDVEDRKKVSHRKRSSSADSSRYLEDYDEAGSRNSPTSSPRKSPMATDRHASNSLTSLPYHTSNKEIEVWEKEVADVIEEDACERTIMEDLIQTKEGEECRSSQGSLPTLIFEGTRNESSSSSSAAAAKNAVHIRRSSSVPCKSGTNRDSSSSNDSGVSTGSLRLRGRDFAEFDLPPATARSPKRYETVAPKSLTGSGCLHASLPRKSKSSDPLREFNFHFQVAKMHSKSSSAEAEVPLCTTKKGYFSPGDTTNVPYMDSRSTSSGTSDMSDYIETLSLSSHSSSDAPDSFSRIPKMAATTLRPRSGNEYHKIDRSILSGDALKHHQRSHYANVEPLPEKSESPSPGYASGSPAHDVRCVDF